MCSGSEQRNVVVGAELQQGPGQLVTLYLKLESRENEWPFACCLFLLWSRTPDRGIPWLVFPLQLTQVTPTGMPIDEHGLSSGDSRLYQSDNQINRGRVLHEDSVLLLNCHLFGGDDKIKQKLSGCSSSWTPKEITFPSFCCMEAEPRAWILEMNGHACPTFILSMHRLCPTGPALILKSKEMILLNREEYRTQEHRPRDHEFIINLAGGPGCCKETG